MGRAEPKGSYCRAIINDPAIILADEPTGALDSETSQQVIKIFDDLVKAGKTLIMVTHNDELAAACYNIAHIKGGLLVDEEKVNE